MCKTPNFLSCCDAKYSLDTQQVSERLLSSKDGALSAVSFLDRTIREHHRLNKMLTLGKELLSTNNSLACECSWLDSQ